MNERKHLYTKSRLIKELAFRVGIKKIASRQILEVLAEIIKRETPNGPFILPGLCKFELVPRKARHIRNPRTGEALILPDVMLRHEGDLFLDGASVAELSATLGVPIRIVNAADAGALMDAIIRDK